MVRRDPARDRRRRRQRAVVRGRVSLQADADGLRARGHGERTVGGFDDTVFMETDLEVEVQGNNARENSADVFPLDDADAVRRRADRLDADLGRRERRGDVRRATRHAVDRGGRRGRDEPLQCEGGGQIRTQLDPTVLRNAERREPTSGRARTEREFETDRARGVERIRERERRRTGFEDFAPGDRGVGTRRIRERVSSR